MKGCPETSVGNATVHRVIIQKSADIT